MAKSYEQSILDLHSTARLRRAVLDNPPEPEVPWHIYPVPTHYTITEDDTWQHYNSIQRPTIYSALRYSDGSVRRSSDWKPSSPSPSKPPALSPSQLMKIDPQGVLPY